MNDTRDPATTADDTEHRPTVAGSTKRRRWGILLFALAVILAGVAEVALRSSGHARVKGCVKIVNETGEAMENLTAHYDGTTISLGRLADGQSMNTWFNAGDLGPLTIDFEQRGNPFSSYQIADYDPAQNRQDVLKLCLTIKNNLIQRSVEDDETRTLLQTFGDRIMNWIKADLGYSEPNPK